jgi:ribosomal subunit interface protein
MTGGVSARLKNISEGFRDYAQQRAKKIGEAFPMVESVRVVMEFQDKYCAAEVIAQRKNETFVGTAHADTSMRAAVDIAAAKVETQIRKKRAKAYVEPARKAAQAAEAAK